jgi:uncharacterized Zn finger protein
MSKQTLKQWFKQKTVEELTDIIMDYVEQSTNEQSRWQLTMLNDQGSLSITDISKQITKALPAEHLYEWKEVDGYFAYAEEMFDQIFVSIEQCSINEQWTLTLKAFKRLNKVLEQIDDSGGFRYTIEGQLKEKLTVLFNLLTWSDDKKAQWIFEHYQSFQYDVFPEVPEDFTLNDNTYAIFVTLCTSEAEQRIQAGVDLSNWKERSVLTRLFDPLLTQAKANNNWLEECRLLAMTAYQTRDYIKISELCLEQNSALDAEHWLQKAYQQAKTSSDNTHCKKFEITLRVATKEYQQAWKIAWQLFSQQPSIYVYKELVALEKNTGVIDSDFTKKSEKILSQVYAENSYGGITQNADALLAFYLYHKQLEKAQTWVLTRKARPDYLLKLADLIAANHPQEAINLYYRVVIVKVGLGNNRAYQEATDLLCNLTKIVKSSDKELLLIMIKKVIKQHKAKRNMMALLKTHFGECF